MNDISNTVKFHFEINMKIIKPIMINQIETMLSFINQFYLDG